MAFPANLALIRFCGVFGTVASPLERWQTTLKLQATGEGAIAELLPFLTAIATASSTFFSNASLAAGSNVHFTELQGAILGPDGKYLGGAGQPTTVYKLPSPTAGAGTTTSPYSQALVISLRTNNLRGYASNGRMYWPATALTVAGTTGRIASGTTNAIATAAATFLNAINTVAAGGGYPNLGSIQVMSNVGAGTAANVTGLRVGSKMDRWEPRESDLIEAYSTATVNP